MSNALPVFSTLLDGFRQLGRHMPVMAPMLGGVAAVNIALGAAHQFAFDAPLAVPDIGQTALRVAVVYALVLPVATSLQRRIVLGAEARVSFTFQREEWLVLGGWLRLFFLFYAFAGALSSVGFTSGLLGKSLESSLPAALPVIIGVNAVFWLVLAFHLLRVSFTLAARAIGLPLTLAEASTALGRRPWRYVVVSLLAALPLAALGGATVLGMGIDPLLGYALGMVAGAVGMLYMAAVAGVVFRHLFPLKVGSVGDTGFVESGDAFLASVRERLAQTDRARPGRRLPWRAIVMVFAVVVNVGIVKAMGGVEVFLPQAQAFVVQQGVPLDALTQAVQAGLASVVTGATELTETTLKDKADQGDAYSQFLMGVSSDMGRNGFAKNIPEAVHYYKLAVAQGDWKAEFNLGLLYLKGSEGVPKNEAEAARLFKLAADQGDVSAELELAELYRHGQCGLPQDEATAGKLYLRAANAGEVYSQRVVGWMYQTGSYGVTKNEVEAVRYYKQAVAQGDDTAANNLAGLYLAGEGGLARNPNEAVRLFELAMTHGYAEAYYRLGHVYDRGDSGLPKNNAKAAELYRKAVALGYQPAQDSLSAMEGRSAK
ncbi:MAG TPA: tetratricopeptide repeat protein [Patescibacteria group bacterium]|nr:tetratricopeptide repeat protein [Patescibacteria group bacterium]